MLAVLLRLAFWSAAATAFVLAVLPQPPSLPVGDKWQHMAAFFTLAVLGSAAYPRLHPLRLGAWLVAFGGLIELVQMVPALHRDGDVIDWGADVLAALAALALVEVYRRIVRAPS